MLDLLEYLLQQYRRELVDLGHTELTADQHVEQARYFADFCRDFLRQYPPQQVIYPQTGLGITLGNSVQVLLAPVDNVAASANANALQPSVSVPLSSPEQRRDFFATTQPGQGRAVNYRLPQAGH